MDEELLKYWWVSGHWSIYNFEISTPTKWPVMQMHIAPDSNTRGEYNFRCEVALLLKISEAKVTMEAEATSVNNSPPKILQIVFSMTSYSSDATEVGDIFFRRRNNVGVVLVFIECNVECSMDSIFFAEHKLKNMIV